MSLLCDAQKHDHDVARQFKINLSVTCFEPL